MWRVVSSSEFVAATRQTIWVRRLTNGLPLPAGRGLLGALAYYGLDSIGADEKGSMRDLILSGGPYSASERLAILDYCQTDVDALASLWSAMAKDLTTGGSRHAQP